MPKPTFDILKLFSDEESFTPSQLQEKLPQFEKKDIKYALRRLREKGVIVRIPNLFDMRRVYYRLATHDEFIDQTSELKLNEITFYQSLMEGTHPEISLIEA